MGNQLPMFIVAAVIILLALVYIISFATFFTVWIRCAMSGAPVPMARLIMMKFRKSNVKKLCELYIMSRQAGLNVNLDELESAYLAGVDVELAVRAMIKASETGQNLTWDDALSQAKKDQYDDYVEENDGDGT